MSVTIRAEKQQASTENREPDAINGPQPRPHATNSAPLEDVKASLDSNSSSSAFSNFSETGLSHAMPSTSGGAPAPAPRSAYTPGAASGPPIPHGVTGVYSDGKAASPAASAGSHPEAEGCHAARAGGTPGGGGVAVQAEGDLDDSGSGDESRARKRARQLNFGSGCSRAGGDGGGGGASAGQVSHGRRTSVLAATAPSLPLATLLPPTHPPTYRTHPHAIANGSCAGSWAGGDVETQARPGSR